MCKIIQIIGRLLFFQFPLLGSSTLVRKDVVKLLTFNSPYWVLGIHMVEIESEEELFQFPLLGSSPILILHPPKRLCFFQFPLLGSKQSMSCIHWLNGVSFNSPYWVLKDMRGGQVRRRLSIPLIGFVVRTYGIRDDKWDDFQFPLLGSWTFPRKKGNASCKNTFNSPYWVRK